MWREHYIAPDHSCVPSGDAENPSCGFKCDEEKADEMVAELISM